MTIHEPVGWWLLHQLSERVIQLCLRVPLLPPFLSLEGRKNERERKIPRPGSERNVEARRWLVPWPVINLP